MTNRVTTLGGPSWSSRASATAKSSSVYDAIGRRVLSVEALIRITGVRLVMTVRPDLIECMDGANA